MSTSATTFPKLFPFRSKGTVKTLLPFSRECVPTSAVWWVALVRHGSFGALQAIVLVHNDLRDIVTAIDLSRKTFRRIRSVSLIALIRLRVLVLSITRQFFGWFGIVAHTHVVSDLVCHYYFPRAHAVGTSSLL